MSTWFMFVFLVTDRGLGVLKLGEAEGDGEFTKFIN